MKILDQIIRAENPSIAYKARMLLRGEAPESKSLRSLRRRIRTSANAQRLLSQRQADGTIPTNPYQNEPRPSSKL